MPRMGDDKRFTDHRLRTKISISLESTVHIQSTSYPRVPPVHDDVSVQTEREISRCFPNATRETVAINQSKNSLLSIPTGFRRKGVLFRTTAPGDVAKRRAIRHRCPATTLRPLIFFPSTHLRLRNQPMFSSPFFHIYSSIFPFLFSLLLSHRVSSRSTRSIAIAGLFLGLSRRRRIGEWLNGTSYC